MHSIDGRPLRFTALALLLCLLLLLIPVANAEKSTGSVTDTETVLFDELAGLRISDVLTKDGKPVEKTNEGKPDATKSGEFIPYTNYTEILVQLFKEGSIKVPADNKAEEDDEVVTDPLKTDGGDDYSLTNVRTPGIDEPDLIKTNGKLIITVDPEEGVAIVDASSMKLLKKIVHGSDNLSSETFDGAMISGAKLIITSTASIMEAATSLTQPYASFYVYNISNPANPILERTVRVKGWLSDVRLLNDTLYAISRQHIGQLDYSDPFTKALPAYYDSTLGKEYRLVNVSDIRHIPGEYLRNYTNITAFKIDAKEPVMVRSEAIFSGDSYMSDHALYLFHKVWGNFSGSGVSTIINRYSLNQGMPHSGSAQVSGSLLNEYAVDEYKGNLRIVTTSVKDNCLFILDSNLRQVGSVKNLASDEWVRGVRFMGDTGYIVTYLEMDPLFVLDLSNSRKPQVLGQLKIPGFSDYLHPFGTKYLIGLGREIAEVSYINAGGKKIITDLVDIGIKASLFDISNPKEPKELSKAVIGGPYSDTSATDNPRMILADESLGLFAFPAYIDESDYPEDMFSEEENSETYCAGIVMGVTPPEVNVRTLLKTQLKGREANDYRIESGMRFCRVGKALYFLYNNMLEKYDVNTFRLLGRARLR